VACRRAVEGAKRRLPGLRWRRDQLARSADLAEELRASWARHTRMEADAARAAVAEPRLRRCVG
jgi:hypothetical protein